MRTKARILRIETRLTGTGATEISAFLNWCTVEELWAIVPPLWLELPKNLQTDYSLVGSHDGLRILYDSPRGNCNFVPMLQGLLTRWRASEPEKLAEVLSECRSFLLHARAQ